MGLKGELGQVFHHLESYLISAELSDQRKKIHKNLS